MLRSGRRVFFGENSLKFAPSIKWALSGRKILCRWEGKLEMEGGQGEVIRIKIYVYVPTLHDECYHYVQQTYTNKDKK